MIKDYIQFRKTKKKVERLSALDSSVIIRDFLLDSRLIEAQQLSMLLGLPEITESAVEASEARSRRIGHLLPLVTYFATSLSSGVMAYFDTVAGQELSKDEQEAMAAWVAKVSISCTLGVLSQLEELDLIKVVR